MIRSALISLAASFMVIAVAPITAFAASGKLTLYTSQPDKIAAETVAAFNKIEPAVQVETFRSGTTEVMNKLQAEIVAGDPRADVLFIADAVTMEQLKADNRLLAFPEAAVVALPAKEKGSPVDFVFPREGVSAVTEPVAVLKTTKNPEAAKAFVTFILSKAGQELAAKQGFLPARKDVAPPPGFPAVGDLNIIPVDLKSAASQDEAMKKKFAALFGG